jgi:hypothetical protein
MKTIKSIGLLMLLLCSLQVFSQTEKFKPASVENSIDFNGNIDSVWAYISNLGHLKYLVPSTIQESVLVGSGIGSIVTITLTNNRGTVIEEVIKLDNEKRIIGYIMRSTPMPIKNYIAHFSVKQLEGSRVSVNFKASFRVQKKNRASRLQAFDKLQIELLTNLKKILTGE